MNSYFLANLVVRLLSFFQINRTKCGVKFFLLVDVDTKYLVNGFPYLGKFDPNSQHKPFGEFVVHSLMKPYYSLGYGDTTDNYFTSINLCNEYKEKRTSLVGTININRRDLPDVKKPWLIRLFTTLKFCDLNLVAH